LSGSGKTVNLIYQLNKIVKVFILSKPDRSLITDITLPPSKSISNRLLIIRALSPGPFRIENLSDSDDTRVLEKALSEKQNTVDIGHAGTSMRFLTGYYSIIPGERVLTGSERMKRRPVGELVRTLSAMGADIQYIQKEGYPPVRIRGKKLEGGRITINSSISSQFISSLLMIAPCLSHGLELNLEGDTVSPAYISLTLKLMQTFGIRYEWKGSVISIPPQVYKPTDCIVEGDWSSASYWYEMASLAEKAELIVRGLSQSGLQGDSVLASLCKDFGVITEYFDSGVRLTNERINISRFDYNFIDHPDLVQTFGVLCALKGIPFRFDGTVTLRVKETDRIQALKEELAKFGISLGSAADGSWIEYDGTPGKKDGTIKIKTYQDHRMAMAFAPAAMAGFKIDVDNPGVVSKSYPDFWEDLKQAGFQIKKSGSSF
jgi:3-phosphoshikimate 1-carboxyvinyltransferase